ncbi:hypothetical protein, partial [Lentimonas sp. CC19]|uniref:hypothetical protein n=1 Tax=Lentimonas sp. CC19 TaxID=2676097 RepID=UPI001A7ED3B3
LSVQCTAQIQNLVVCGYRACAYMQRASAVAKPRFDSDAGQPQAASPQLTLGAVHRANSEPCGLWLARLRVYAACESSG